LERTRIFESKIPLNSPNRLTFFTAMNCVRSVWRSEASGRPFGRRNELYQTGVFILPNGEIAQPNAAFDHSNGGFILPTTGAQAGMLAAPVKPAPFNIFFARLDLIMDCCAKYDIMLTKM
jgi:hypothetical protein